MTVTLKAVGYDSISNVYATRQAMLRGLGLTVLDAMNPEKKPPLVAGWQALLKSPMTTEWLPPASNVNSRTSPCEAEMELGEKLRPVLPTWIWIVFAVVCTARPATIIH